MRRRDRARAARSANGRAQAHARRNVPERLESQVRRGAGMTTLPAGYRYAAVHAGIRRDARADLALIVSDHPASAAAMFTLNRVQAAPVRLARRHLEQSRGVVKAILVNAGNANCATRTGDAVA